jgi:hypothetical protein
MPAELVAFDGNTTEDPKGHTKYLRGRFYEAWREMKGADSRFTAYADHLESRVRLLERTVRALLNSDSLRESERAAGVDVLFGAQGKVFRDGKLNTDLEIRMLAAYRTMDAPARQMMRTLSDRLAATSAPKGGA